MNFSSTPNIVHELEPKKMGIWSAGKQNIIQIFSNLRVSTFWKKYDELSKSVAFGKKLRYFTDQNGPK